MFKKTFSDALKLPTQNVIDNSMNSVMNYAQQQTAGLVGQATSYIGSVGSQLGGIVDKGKQLLSNFNKPSLGEKQVEALLKMQGGFQNGPFSSLSKDIDIKKLFDGSQVAVDAQTNTSILELNKEDTSATAADGNAAMAGRGEDQTEALKVKLTGEPTAGGLQTITFDVMPSISESRTVEYDTAMTPIHHPGEILKYKSTGGREWSIDAKLISRNVEEATYNLKAINTIRAWMMPFYGEGTAKNFKKYLGSPPPIITLQAYGKSMIGPVKCVIKSANWTWPNDVDYVKALSSEDGNVSPFPAVISLTISLAEAWSPAEFSGFDIAKYYAGDLPAAFTSTSRLGQDFSNVNSGVSSSADSYNMAEPELTGQRGDPIPESNFDMAEPEITDKFGAGFIGYTSGEKPDGGNY